jgi:2-keto-4-pentenoate hydratase
MSTAYTDPRIRRGMATQLKLRQDRLEAGEKPLGWKVGFGAPTAMERLGIDAPLVGSLTDRTLLRSDATLALAGWTKPAVEPEIAVYLGEDLLQGADRETARAAVASVGPALELADVSFPPEDVEAILAGNIYNRHVVLGRVDASRAGCVLDGLVGHVYRNGREAAATTDPQALTGDLIGIVRHVAELLAALGERLRAGEVIITGSIVPPLWIESNEAIRFTLDPIDTISINLTNGKT